MYEIKCNDVAIGLEYFCSSSEMIKEVPFTQISLVSNYILVNHTHGQSIIISLALRITL